MAARPIVKACGTQASAAAGPSLLGIAIASSARVVRRLYAKRAVSDQRGRGADTLLAGVVIGAMLSALATSATALLLSHVERGRIAALRDSAEPRLAAKEQVAALARDWMGISALFSRAPASDTLEKLGAYVPSDARFVAIEQDARGATTIEIVAGDLDTVADALRAEPGSKGFVQSRLWSDDWGRPHLVFQRAPQ
jgi:hypothetical protein